MVRAVAEIIGRRGQNAGGDEVRREQRQRELEHRTGAFATEGRTADAQRFAEADDVTCELTMIHRHDASRIVRAAMPTQIGQNKAVVRPERVELGLPCGSGAVEAVEEHEWRAMGMPRLGIIHAHIANHDRCHPAYPCALSRVSRVSMVACLFT